MRRKTNLLNPYIWLTLLYIKKTSSLLLSKKVIQSWHIFVKYFLFFIISLRSYICTWSSWSWFVVLNLRLLGKNLSSRDLLLKIAIDSAVTTSSGKSEMFFWEETVSYCVTYKCQVSQRHRGGSYCWTANGFFF